MKARAALVLLALLACTDGGADLGRPDAGCGAGCAMDGGVTPRPDGGGPGADASVPGLPAKARLLCPSEPGPCGAPAADLVDCRGVNLSAALGADCAQPLMLVAEADPAFGGQLEVAAVTVEVQELNQGITLTGDDSGFSVYADPGAPVGGEPPWILDVAPGQSQASLPLWVSFDGRPGLYRGDPSRGGGIRFVFGVGPSDDLVLPVTAIGYAADLTVLIDNQVKITVDELGVPPLEATRGVHNFGDATLEITGLLVDPPGAGLDVDLSSGLPTTLAPNEQATLTFTLTPRTFALTRYEVGFESNAYPEAPTVTVWAGRWGELDVTPGDVLGFSGRGAEILRLENVGTAPLTIDRLEIVGLDGDPSAPAAGLFRLVGCESGACLPFDIPPPTAAPASVELSVEYAGSPGGTQAKLLIGSSDPFSAGRELLLVDP